jgi:hypothetical protein
MVGSKHAPKALGNYTFHQKAQDEDRIQHRTAPSFGTLGLSWVRHDHPPGSAEGIGDTYPFANKPQTPPLSNSIPQSDRTIQVSQFS